MTGDFRDTTLNSWSADQTPYIKGYDKTAGFFGTFDGQGNTITSAGNGTTGIFGLLRSATIKNVKFVDVYRSLGKGCSFIARACYNTIFENVTFECNYTDKTQTSVGNGYGWIAASEFSGNTLKNVTVNDKQGYSLSLIHI